MHVKFHILMIIEGEIATTQITERLFMSLASYGVTYEKRLSSELQESDFNTNTLPIFMRSSNPCLVYWADFLKRANHPYFYYLDDNFWLLKGNSPVAKYYQNKLIRTSLRYIIKRANIVLVHSMELAEFLVSFNKNIHLLTPTIDFSLIPKKHKKQSDEIRIGFAGSTSRINDLDIIAPVVTNITDEFPHVVFEFAGAMPKNIVEGERVRFFPYKDNYLDYLIFQMERHWDIGLAPLIDNASNRCKTNNKYREYGACGIAGIYSNIPLYMQSIRSGVNGIIVENSPEAWLIETRHLIENQPLREEISKKAREDVFEKYSVDVVKDAWFNAFKLLEKELQLSKISSPRHRYLKCIIKYYLKLSMAYQSRNKLDFVKILGIYGLKSMKLFFQKMIQFFI